MLAGGGGAGKARESGEACVQLDAQHPLLDVSVADPLASLYHTGAAARWRRKHDDYFASSSPHVLTAVRHRPMEEVHGVDVSWTHHPGKSQGTSLLNHFLCAPTCARTRVARHPRPRLTTPHRKPPQGKLDLPQRIKLCPQVQPPPAPPSAPPPPRYPSHQASRRDRHCPTDDRRHARATRATRAARPIRATRLRPNTLPSEQWQSSRQTA